MEPIHGRIHTPKALVAYNGADSGLGNRIRVTLGAKILAEHEHRHLFYVWPTGPLFGPKLTDLWDFQGGTRIPRTLSRSIARLYPYETNDLASPPAEVTGRRVRQIRTGGELHLPEGLRSWRKEFRDLVPASAIAARVDDFFTTHLKGRPYVGVQIRAHTVSHPQTKDASPVSWFIDRMTTIAARQPGTVFFVSCDVPEVLSHIQTLIPNVYGLTDKGGYNTTEGVQSSVVDLYLLASASYLIGSHFSSFLHLAVHLADGRIPIETSQHVSPEVILLPDGGSVTDARIPSTRPDAPQRPVLRAT